MMVEAAAVQCPGCVWVGFVYTEVAQQPSSCFGTYSSVPLIKPCLSPETAAAALQLYSTLLNLTSL